MEFRFILPKYTQWSFFTMINSDDFIVAAVKFSVVKSFLSRCHDFIIKLGIDLNSSCADDKVVNLKCSCYRWQQWVRRDKRENMLESNLKFCQRRLQCQNHRALEHTAKTNTIYSAQVPFSFLNFPSSLCSLGLETLCPRRVGGRTNMRIISVSDENNENEIYLSCSIRIYWNFELANIFSQFNFRHT